jgi:site-specific DNA-cytosine methylase
MQEGSGTRSSLAFEFVRLVRELKPRYLLWENVAGVLSDKSFPEFLSALANCGYGVAYRTLDAQWVRVADCYHADGGVVRMERAIPQRRRRVWVVGCIGGDVTKAAEILFESKSVAGDTPPRRRTGQEIAAASRGRNRVHGEMVGGAPRDGETIALDGDKLKPRTDQRKGGNGFGINEDGAGYTLTGVDRHGVAYKSECYENHAQDSRVREITVAPTIPQKAGTGGNNLPLAVHTKGFTDDAKTGSPCAEEVSQTLIQGTSPGHKCGIITTNSNGGDVMPTLTNDLVKQTGNQQAVGGVHYP